MPCCTQKSAMPFSGRRSRRLYCTCSTSGSRAPPSSERQWFTKVDADALCCRLGQAPESTRGSRVRTAQQNTSNCKDWHARQALPPGRCSPRRQSCAAAGECTGSHRRLLHVLGPDLVADKLDAAVLHGLDSGDIEVCQPQVLDGAPLLLICKPLGSGQIPPLAVVLPVKLHKVQRRGANPLEGLLDGLQAGQSALESPAGATWQSRPVEDSCADAMHAADICICIQEGGVAFHDRSAQMCMHCQHMTLHGGVGHYFAKHSKELTWRTYCSEPPANMSLPKTHSLVATVTPLWGCCCR